MNQEYISYPGGSHGYRRRVGVVTAHSFLTVICAMVTFKYAFNYYSFVVPAFSSAIYGLYFVVTLFMLALFFPMAGKVLLNLRRQKYKMLLPAVIIPLCVLLNIFYVMISSGDFSILSRGYRMPLAYGTNDEIGFYFAQINTWFGNMAVVMYLAIYTQDKKDIVKCLCVSMAVLVIPTVLIIAMHPSYLGMRQSTFGEGVTFGGGLWNVGVVGYGSISWLGMALAGNATKRQRRFIYFSVFLFVFVGVAGVSRTLILMVAFSWIVYFLLDRKDMHWLKKVLLMLLGVLVFVTFETDFILNIVIRFGDATGGTSNIRFRLWEAYLSHFREYWFIGAPLGSVYNYYKDVNLFGANFLPHSSVVNFLVRFGIFALLSYLILLRRAFLPPRLGEHALTRSHVCMASGGVAYITLAFINQTGYAEPVFYIMFGLALAYWRIEEAETPT